MSSRVIGAAVVLCLGASPALGDDQVVAVPKNTGQDVVLRLRPPRPMLASTSLMTPVARASHGDIEVTEGPALLRGVIVVRHSAATGLAAPASTQPGVSFADLPYLDTDALRHRLSSRLGQEFSEALLDELVADVILESRRQGRAVVDVFVPEQRVTNGVLVVAVTVATIGRLTIEGTEWFSEDRIRRQVRLRPGEDLNSDVLEADLAWLNLNPFRSVTAVLSPGAAPGTTDVSLKVDDRLPVQVFAGYNNAGTPATGLNRYSAGFHWGNVFGLEHRLDFQHVRSDENLRSTTLGYQIPLPWHDYVHLILSRARYHLKPTGPFDQNGRSEQQTALYGITLDTPAEERSSREIYLGAERKKSNVRLSFGGEEVYSSAPVVAQGVLGYRGTYRDASGRTFVDASVRYSPGDLLPRNDKESFQVVRQGAAPDYAYLRGTIERLQSLESEVDLSVQATGQISNRNLLYSEKLSLGGVGSVRGYHEDVYSGDYGVIANLELRFPPRSLTSLLGVSTPADALQPVLFFDWGYVAQHENVTPADKPKSLAGIGAGLRYQIHPGGTARLDVAKPLGTEPGRERPDGPRIHASVSVLF